MPYLSKETLKVAISELAFTNETIGKKGQEHTTPIFVFLALDRCLKQSETQEIDLAPNSEGREAFKTAFSSIADFDVEGENYFQIKDLCRIDTDCSPAKDRIGNNFLTTQVKRASEASEPKEYPNRPKLPVVSIGPSIKEGTDWGMKRSSAWKTNFLKLLEGRRCAEDTAPLIIISMHNEEFTSSDDFKETIRAKLFELHTTEVSEFLWENATWI